MWSLWLLGGLVGCSSGLGDELPAALSEPLEACRGLGGGTRDWCAFETLETLEGLTGRQARTVCEELSEVDARDKCFELTVRLDDPPDDEVCEEIRGETLSYSCWLTVADHVMLSGTIDEAIAGCRRTGPLLGHCLSHIADRRFPRWRIEGMDAMLADIAQVVAAIPEARDEIPLGNAVAKTSGMLGVARGSDAPCRVLPEGRAREGCIQGLRMTVPGRPQASGRP
ncbi:MAG: hypothetical protein QGG40_06095 [Myxococcota bacterium]|nr:hypothetical protein [Myxococcota bacterium]